MLLSWPLVPRWLLLELVWQVWIQETLRGSGVVSMVQEDLHIMLVVLNGIIFLGDYGCLVQWTTITHTSSTNPKRTHKIPSRTLKSHLESSSTSLFGWLSTIPVLNAYLINSELYPLPFSLTCLSTDISPFYKFEL